MRFWPTSGSRPATQNWGASRAELGSRTGSGGNWRQRARADECRSSVPGKGGTRRPELSVARQAGVSCCVAPPPRGCCLPAGFFSTFTAETRGECGPGCPAAPSRRGVCGARLWVCTSCGRAVLGHRPSVRGRWFWGGVDLEPRSAVATPSLCESCRVPASCVCPRLRACPASRAAGSAGRRLS